jgi:hypothetical protein
VKTDAKQRSSTRSTTNDGAGGLTCEELAAWLGFHVAPGFRGAADFFDLLVAVRALDRHGERAPTLREGCYPSVTSFLGRDLQNWQQCCGCT